ncbi:MAG: hypothetical protein JJV92_05845 [Desulfosarcina sp.]|nr:hypothetical protein [Desulfobacterales bacterium]
MKSIKATVKDAGASWEPRKSCILAIKMDNPEEYSRVCTDGSMFGSEKICWGKL